MYKNSYLHPSTAGTTINNYVIKHENKVRLKKYNCVYPTCCKIKQI